MPGMVRKIAVSAAVDGLVLQPIKQQKQKQNQRATPALLIKYSTNEIVPLGSTSRLDIASHDVLEAHGVVGTTNFTVSIEMLYLSDLHRAFQRCFGLVCYSHLSKTPGCANSRGAHLRYHRCCAYPIKCTLRR